ncbi:MAG TPA: LicD family protein [Bacteroidales bacterium]|nr:LicD family protein [Bacteroidales bacterium]
MKRRIPLFDDFDINEHNITGLQDSQKEERDKLLKQNLHEIIKICDKYKVPYWLDAGTLLGLYRDKDLIKGDSDNDIGINIKDVTYEFVNALAEHANFPMSKQSFYSGEELSKLFDTDEFVPVKNLKYTTLNDKKQPVKIDTEIWTDLVFYCDNEDYLTYKIARNYFRQPKKFLKSLKSIRRNGYSYKIPGDVEGYLEQEYGEGWSTPDTSYSSYQDKSRKNIYVIPAKDFEKKYGKMFFNFKTGELKYEKQ